MIVEWIEYENDSNVPNEKMRAMCKSVDTISSRANSSLRTLLLKEISFLEDLSPKILQTMADEDLTFANNVEQYDDNEMDMDYMDINDDLEPEPTLVPTSSHHQVTRSRAGTHHQVGHQRIQSYSMDQRTQTLIKQYESNISELQMELKQAADENEALTMKNETLIIEYDAKIDELNLEMDQMQIESQQYQIRYSEINEELHDLRNKQNDSQSADQQNKELLLRLQNKEQNEMALVIDLEQANKSNLSLKEQLNNAHQNLSKLQNAMLRLKKDKTQTDKNLNAAMEKLQISQQTVL